MTCCSAIASSCSPRPPARGVAACRTLGCTARPTTPGSARSTVTVSRMLRPRERRRPKMPNQLPRMVEERIVELLDRPSGPRTQAGGVGAAAREVGRARRLAQRRLEGALPPRAQHARQAARADRRLRGALRAAARSRPERHIDVERPGELVGIDCFYVGRLKGTKGAIWQLTAIDVASSFGWAELVVCKHGQPNRQQTSKLARRVAGSSRPPAGASSACSPTTATSSTATSTRRSQALRPPQPHPRRPPPDQRQRRSAAQDDPRRVLAPRFARYIYPRLTGLRRELDTYLRFYNHDRVHHGRLTRGQIPADIVYGARKMERDQPPCRHISESRPG